MSALRLKDKAQEIKNREHYRLHRMQILGGTWSRMEDNLFQPPLHLYIQD